MKKLLLLTFLVLMVVPMVFGEQSQDKKYAEGLPDLIPYRKGDKWGFCDKDKNIVIECKYEDVESFNNKLARVCAKTIVFNTSLGKIKLKKRFGFIDKTGSEKISISYQKLFDYSYYYWPKSTLIIVRHKGKEGLFNRKGEIVVPVIYKRCSCIGNDYYAAWNEEGKCGVFDNQGNKILPIEFNDVGGIGDNLIPARIEGFWGFYDLNGKEVLPHKYIRPNSFKEGYCVITGEYESCHYFIDTKGQFVFKAYNFIHSFNEGYAVVNEGFSETTGGYYGLINKKGEIVLPIKYYRLGKPQLGVIPAQFEEGWYLIDLKGNKLSKKYDYISDWGGSYINFEGKKSLRLNVELNGKVGLINEKGEEILSPQYEVIGFYSDNYVSVNVGGSYNERRSFKGVTWGFLDENGKVVISIKYESVSNFKNGLAEVKYKGKKGYIDKNGTEYWED